MVVGVNGGLRTEAANAENQEQGLDDLHAWSPFGADVAATGITATRDGGSENYQEMPYFAAIRRAFASSPSRRLA